MRRGGLAAGGAITLGMAGYTRPARGRQGPNDKLNIAVIGVGGRGGSNLESVASENIVALCDVYERAGAPGRAAISRREKVQRFPAFVRPGEGL